MKTEDIEAQLNQARSKPDTVDRPVRTARTFVTIITVPLELFNHRS